MKSLDDCFDRGYLRKISPDIASARKSIQLSSKNIEAAETNLSESIYYVALILSYTAMFHAARVILFKDGVKEHSHECIPIYIAARYPDLRMYANILDAYRQRRQ